MFGALLSAVNSLIYTFLAFCLPAYFTVKSLLRQYTVSIVAPTSFASGSMNLEDDSEVPSNFIEPVKSLLKTETTSYVSNTNVTPNAIPTNSHSAWLQYWAILAVLHCATGLYERVFLPLFGNSFLYHCAKYFALYWLTRDEAQASRTLWTALVAPFAAKYEKEADRLVQACRSEGRRLVTQSVASLREFSRKTASTGSVKVAI